MRRGEFCHDAPVTNRLALEGRKQETARVTEVMATEMVGQFEDRRVRIPIDQVLRESLRKPERVVTATGRVSIAATRDEAGHADHFWSLALALYAARQSGGPTGYQAVNHEAAMERLRRHGRKMFRERALVGC
jgi:phage FluMu gp28-like protein